MDIDALLQDIITRADKDRLKDDALITRTADLMGLADVQRWTVIKKMRDQSVAEHSFLVAVITIELVNRLKIAGWEFPSQSFWGDVLAWALMHDAPETLTGDIDGKFKREYPAVRSVVVAGESDAFPWYHQFACKVLPVSNYIVKVADKIEAIAFIKQWGVGSRADAVYRDLYKMLFEEVVPSHAAKGLEIDTARWVAIVRTVTHYSVQEFNNIQDRLARRKAETAEPPAGACQQDDSAAS